MANAWLLRPHPVAAVTASATSLGAPANLTNDFMGIVWKADAAAIVGAGPYFHFVTFDMGADVAADTIIVPGMKGPPGSATFSVNIATAAQGPSFSGSAFWSSAAVPAFAGDHLLANGDAATLLSFPEAGTPPAGRYWRIYYQASAPFPVLLRRVVIGTRWSPERNFGFGAAFGVKDLGSADFSPRGVPLSRVARKLRTVGLTFSALYRDEIEDVVQPFVEQVGNTEPFALVTDPAAHANRTRRIYYGTLVGDLGTARRTAAAWEWKLNMASRF